MGKPKLIKTHSNNRPTVNQSKKKRKNGSKAKGKPKKASQSRVFTFIAAELQREILFVRGTAGAGVRLLRRRRLQPGGRLRRRLRRRLFGRLGRRLNATQESRAANEFSFRSRDKRNAEEEIGYF